MQEQAGTKSVIQSILGSPTAMVIEILFNKEEGLLTLACLTHTIRETQLWNEEIL